MGGGEGAILTVAEVVGLAAVVGEVAHRIVGVNIFGVLLHEFWVGC